MGKKSLIKSTSKKKSASSKKKSEDLKKSTKTTSGDKKTETKKTAASGKKATAKTKVTKAAAKKTAAKPKTAAKKTATKSKATVKTKVAKAAAKPKRAAKAKKKPVPIKELLMKKFDAEVPETLYTVPKSKKAAVKFTAPSILDGYDKKDAKRIKKLLTNTYSVEDLKAATEKAAAEKAAAEKAAAEKAAAEKAAAEKAAAEKAAAEKAAAEKAAAEKAAAEKAAAEKAAAEKAAAEKAAAEKAAAEKAAAEKAAAEKAAAEKAAAEKAAAEKAAAEKAAAEKAAAEKAAAEKAAAEKAAAEKAAAEKAAAEIKAKAEAKEKVAALQAESKPTVNVTYAAPQQTNAKPTKKESDPVENSMKLFAAGLAFLILLIIGASISNSGKYYLVEKEGALEIRKGKFAPLGDRTFIVLPGVLMPDIEKKVYSRDDVSPIAFNFYIEKADALLETPGIPDFEEIKAIVNDALKYASSRELKKAAYSRIDNIDKLIFLYKADVAASKETIPDLETAIEYLDEADSLTTDPLQEEMIARKIEILKERILAIEAAEEAALVEAEAAAVEAEESAAEGAAAEETEGEVTEGTDQEQAAEAGGEEASGEPAAGEEAPEH